MKKCKKCKELKDFSEFDSHERGISLNCKICKIEIIKEYKERKRLHQLEYYKSNIEYFNDYNKNYYNDNKLYFSEYYKKNHNYSNRELINKKRRERRNIRINEDPLFRLSENIRGLIRVSLNNVGYSKNSKTYEILGCSFEHLLNYLDDNTYGFKYSDNLNSHKYDLDHIIPLSSAKSEEELLELSHYTNLQLLPYLYNRNVKKDKIFDSKDLIEWLTINDIIK